jgi:hypothetical protein
LTRDFQPFRPPEFDLAAQPELATTLSQVNHWAGHSRIPALVCRDGVALRQTKELGDRLGVD